MSKRLIETYSSAPLLLRKWTNANNVLHADGNKYAWDGNWGAKCGGNWFYSNIFIKGTSNAEV